MGHAIERIALGRGHEIVCRIDADNTALLGSEEFAKADVAIEFTTPATAAGNIRASVEAGVPVVCGSTGWYDSLPDVGKAVEQAGSALLASTNFSVGVYLTRLANSYLASLMGRVDAYRPTLSETHHVHKLDYPSGTAITMAGDLVDNCRRIDRWECVGEVRMDEPQAAEEARAVDERIAATPADVLPVAAYRHDEVAGIHSVEWDSEADTILLRHSAKSRDGFALGAVMAAEWLCGRKGVFTIDDMMNDFLDL